MLSSLLSGTLRVVLVFVGSSGGGRRLLMVTLRPFFPSSFSTSAAKKKIEMLELQSIYWQKNYHCDNKYLYNMNYFYSGHYHKLLRNQLKRDIKDELQADIKYTQ